MEGATSGLSLRVGGLLDGSRVVGLVVSGGTAPAAFLVRHSSIDALYIRPEMCRNARKGFDAAGSSSVLLSCLAILSSLSSGNCWRNLLLEVRWLEEYCLYGEKTYKIRPLSPFGDFFNVLSFLSNLGSTSPEPFSCCSSVLFPWS